jgi:general secretion pathway protein G
LVTYRLLAGNFPTSEQGLQALVERPLSPPVPLRWEPLFEELPSDSWGHALYYRIDAVRPHAIPEVLSAGPDGVIDNEDDVTSRKNK